jgi:hypothetical protein
MSNKPQVKVRGMKQDLDKKEKNEKPTRSNFLLTINTNQQIEKENIDRTTESKRVSLENTVISCRIHFRHINRI